MPQFWDSYVPECRDCKSYERDLQTANKLVAKLEEDLRDLQEAISPARVGKLNDYYIGVASRMRKSLLDDGRVVRAL